MSTRAGRGDAVIVTTVCAAARTVLIYTIVTVVGYLMFTSPFVALVVIVAWELTHRSRRHG